MECDYLFSKQEREKARETDIAKLLRSRGEAVKRVGREYEWLDRGQKVSIRGNLWFHQYERIGGDAVDFVCKFYGKSYNEAVAFLLRKDVRRNGITQNEEDPDKSFSLPAAHENTRRLYSYLVNRRGIDRMVLDAFAFQNMVYESVPYHNAVFVGYDKNGVAKHAHKRGTGMSSQFKGNVANSLPEYSFHWTGTDNTLYLFEAPIDMLSFISLHMDGWRRHSYAAACCVGDDVLWQMLSDNPQINTVYLCMDNDEAGQSACKRISEKLFVKGIKDEILAPRLKDWNEDLLSKEKKE